MWRVSRWLRSTLDSVHGRMAWWRWLGDSGLIHWLPPPGVRRLNKLGYIERGLPDAVLYRRPDPASPFTSTGWRLIWSRPIPRARGRSGGAGEASGTRLILCILSLPSSEEGNDTA